MILEEKYIFHIPLFKYENDKIISIDMDNILNELICEFAEKGFENLYIIKARGHYKSRSYDELLITIYTSKNENQTLPNEIFEKWFKNNNNILKQESFGYEYNNRMFIESL